MSYGDWYAPQWRHDGRRCPCWSCQSYYTWTSSSLSLDHAEPWASFALAIKRALEVAPNASGKPTVRREGGRWVVRWSPLIIMRNTRGGWA